MRVATEAGSGPLASLSVSVDVGSRYESSANNGTCAVTAASAFKVSTPVRIDTVISIVFSKCLGTRKTCISLIAGRILSDRSRHCSYARPFDLSG